jgi:hypothetical protein
MKTTREAARRLRESNPVADDAYSGAAGERLGQITFNHIISEPARSAATTAAESATVPRRRRRAGLLAGGLGLAAAGVAAVIVVALAGPVVPGAPAPAGHHGPAGQSAAQRFLLDAAATAAARPGRSGTYWYVGATISVSGSRENDMIWFTRNGLKSWLWVGSKKHGGYLHNWVRWSRPGWSLLLGAADSQLPFAMLTRGKNTPQLFSSVARIGWVSFRQLQSLPTSPAVLKARIATLTRNNEVPESVAVFGSLVNLVTGLPTPPQVRAAAFRALATLPIVTAAVPVRGRPALRINTSMFLGPRYTTLVVDPATSRVRAVMGYGSSESVSMTARWVNSRIPPMNDRVP